MILRKNLGEGAFGKGSRHRRSPYTPIGALITIYCGKKLNSFLLDRGRVEGKNTFRREGEEDGLVCWAEGNTNESENERRRSGMNK